MTQLLFSMTKATGTATTPAPSPVTGYGVLCEAWKFVDSVDAVGEVDAMGCAAGARATRSERIQELQAENRYRAHARRQRNRSFGPVRMLWEFIAEAIPCVVVEPYLRVLRMTRRVGKRMVYLGGLSSFFCVALAGAFCCFGMLPHPKSN